MVIGEESKKIRLIQKFHDLIEHGDVLECEKLNKGNKLDLNTPMGKEKYSALHKACYYGHLECIHWLVWHSADINIRSMQGWTPAHIAAIRGKDQCIEALITHRADMTMQDEAGQCPIHLSAAHGNNFTLQNICRKGGDVDIRDLHGWKAVHHAAHNGKLGCLQTLVKWGADLETVTLGTGDTPLHLAAAQDHMSVVKYILSKVEDWVSALSCINNDAETALERAILFSQHSVVDYLSNLHINEINEVDEGFPAHVAAAQGDIDTLTRLIGSGLYSVNCVDDHQSTPAHKAAGHGQAAALQWLLDNGADIELVNGSQETVKEVAKRFGRTECVELLGGYSDDEVLESSPEEVAMNKVGLLESELKDAKIAATQLGGHLSQAVDTNAILSETQELKDLLEHERRKREKMEATIDELRLQVQNLAREPPTKQPNYESSEDSSHSLSTNASSTVSSVTEKRNKKKRTAPKKNITRGVFIKNIRNTNGKSSVG